MWEYFLVKITNFEVCFFSFHKSVSFFLPLLPVLRICAYCYSH